MRKVLIGIVVVVLLAIGLAPVAGGFLTEQEYKNAAREVGVLTPVPGVRITLDPSLYERGLMQSKAWTSVDLGPSARVVLQHTIHHGPISFAKLGEGLAIGVIDSQIDPAKLQPGETSPIRIKTVLRLNGDLHVEFEGDPRQGEDFTLDGARGELDVTDRGETIRADIEIAGFESDPSSESSLRIQNSKLLLDLRQSELGIPLGTTRFTADDLQVVRNGETATLDDVALQQVATLDQAANQLGIAVQLAFDRIELPDRLYEAGDFRLEARNLDAKSLGELQRQRAAGLSNAQMRTALQAAAPALLAAGPEIELTSAKVNTLSGPFDASAKLRGKPEMANIPLSSALAALALFELDASFDMSQQQVAAASEAAARAQAEMRGMPIAPEQLTAAADALTQLFVSQGYLQTSDQGGDVRYTTDLSFANGALKLNGQTVNPMLLLSGQSSASLANDEYE